MARITLRLGDFRGMYAALIGALLLAMTTQDGLALRTVVIDVGHGGHDNGASMGLIYEKHLALDVARRLEVYLKSKGIHTVMTRERDEYISLPSRCSMANKQKDSVFVSIHFNSGGRTGAMGIETFYASSEGYKLGSQIHSELIGQLRVEDRGLKWRRYYVLRNTRVPAVLVECGFLSNSSERERCLQPWYRQLVAQSIGKGIVDYKRDR